MIGPEKEEHVKISVMLTSHWVTIKKQLSIIRKQLKIATGIGDRAGEGRAYESLGNGYQSFVDIEKPLSITKFEICNGNL